MATGENSSSILIVANDASPTQEHEYDEQKQPHQHEIDVDKQRHQEQLPLQTKTLASDNSAKITNNHNNSNNNNNMTHNNNNNIQSSDNENSTNSSCSNSQGSRVASKRLEAAQKLNLILPQTQIQKVSLKTPIIITSDPAFNNNGNCLSQNATSQMLIDSLVQLNGQGEWSSFTGLPSCTPVSADRLTVRYINPFFCGATSAASAESPSKQQQQQQQNGNDAHSVDEEQSNNATDLANKELQKANEFADQNFQQHQQRVKSTMANLQAASALSPMILSPLSLYGLSPEQEAWLRLGYVSPNQHPLAGRTPTEAEIYQLNQHHQFNMYGQRLDSMASMDHHNHQHQNHLHQRQQYQRQQQYHQQARLSNQQQVAQDLTSSNHNNNIAAASSNLTVPRRQQQEQVQQQQQSDQLAAADSMAHASPQSSSASAVSRHQMYHNLQQQYSRDSSVDYETIVIASLNQNIQHHHRQQQQEQQQQQQQQRFLQARSGVGVNSQSMGQITGGGSEKTETMAATQISSADQPHNHYQRSQHQQMLNVSGFQGNDDINRTFAHKNVARDGEQPGPSCSPVATRFIYNQGPSRYAPTSSHVNCATQNVTAATAYALHGHGHQHQSATSQQHLASDRQRKIMIAQAQSQSQPIQPQLFTLQNGEQLNLSTNPDSIVYQNPFDQQDRHYSHQQSDQSHLLAHTGLQTGLSYSQQQQQQQQQQVGTSESLSHSNQQGPISCDSNSSRTFIQQPRVSCANGAIQYGDTKNYHKSVPGVRLNDCSRSLGGTGSPRPSVKTANETKATEAKIIGSVSDGRETIAGVAATRLPSSLSSSSSFSSSTSSSTTYDDKSVSSMSTIEALEIDKRPQTIDLTGSRSNCSQSDFRPLAGPPTEIEISIEQGVKRQQKDNVNEISNKTSNELAPLARQNPKKSAKLKSAKQLRQQHLQRSEKMSSAQQGTEKISQKRAAKASETYNNSNGLSKNVVALVAATGDGQQQVDGEIVPIKKKSRGGRKKKLVTHEEMIARKNRSKERNRVAARRCRQKRKQFLDELRDKIDSLNELNQKLQKENSVLRSELDLFKQQQSSHACNSG